MATLTTFAPFNQSQETWDSFLDRFDCFLAANDYKALPEDRKQAVFLSVCGHDMFETARALLAPLRVQDVPWESLMAKLKGHYAPLPSRVARRYAFRHRYQAEGETINQYMAALRTAALYCQFRDLEDQLLDQLICGVRDVKLQRRLLARTDDTLQTALDEARASELSHKSSTEMQRPTSPGAARKSAVHQDTVDDDSPSDDDEVCRLKTAPKSNWEGGFPKKASPPCAGCGGSHNRSACRFRDAECRRCGKRGHLAKVCRATLPDSSKHRKPAGREFQQQKRAAAKDEDCYTIYRDRWQTKQTIAQARGRSTGKIFLTVHIESQPCRMEVDTGSALSLVSWSTFKRLVPSMSKRRLSPCRYKLRDYQGAAIPIWGSARVRVQHGKFRGRLRLVVVGGTLPSLIGLDWFDVLGLAVTGIHTTNGDGFASLVDEFAEVFSEGLGTYKGTPVSFNLDPSVAPIRLKPRRVPLALRQKVDLELDKLIAQGVLEPVDYAKWETPIVIPIKPDGSIRICADYKATLNKALQANPYPVPVVQQLLHSLGRGSVFAKLDMAQAYQQLLVDSDAAEAQTIVTHRGAFKCNRLQFGVCIAPGIFQSLVERLLQGIPGVVPYFDDVFVSAKNDTELRRRLREVLSRFRQAGLKLRPDKCFLGAKQVEFLGYLVDAAGIHPTPAKVNAVTDAPPPSSKAELQAFLGLLNFYNMFLPHKATVAEPLHRLLKSQSPWVWGRLEAASFQAVKRLLTSASVLVQYDCKLPLTLACDASPYGVGAVLSHRLPDGKEAPIAYFSRTMSPTERRYSQIDKEALAAVAGVKRFHHYLYGRAFDLLTDHKPLLGILAGDRQTPQIISPRMARWVEFLSAYNYKLFHRPGKALGHADALSRCPLPMEVSDPAPVATVLQIDDSCLPITAADIARLTVKDSTLRQVLDWVRRGWPLGKTASEFLPFRIRQHELALQRGCLLWGSRVVVPPPLRSLVLSALHVGHPGIARMKALGRSYVWWPRLDQDIAQRVSCCSPCQLSRPAAPAAPPCEWETPRAPWARLHLDFAGPVQGKSLLVVVDAYSKWVEVVPMSSTTAESLIRALHRLFSTHGLPDVVVSDNGPQFTSAAFQVFLAQHGIRHAPVAPFHPASNGLAERAVRSAKEALLRFGPGDLHAALATYLLTQHSTPCPVSRRSPAELLMGRRLRLTLDRLHPSFSPEVPLDSGSGVRSFGAGDLVYARNYGGDPRWVPGTIVGVAGPRSYRVLLVDGRTWRRHIDQLRARRLLSAGEQSQSMPNTRDQALLPQVSPTPPPSGISDSITPSSPIPGNLPVNAESCQSPGPSEDEPLPAPQMARKPSPCRAPPTPSPGPRRSGRRRRSPAYLDDYMCARLGERSVISWHDRRRATAAADVGVCWRGNRQLPLAAATRLDTI